MCCEQDVGAADKLFATLDTKIRRAATVHGQPFLLVDTVGFIQGLPLQLVAAFQATLDEALEADLVVCTPSTVDLDCMLEGPPPVPHSLQAVHVHQVAWRCCSSTAIEHH